MIQIKAKLGNVLNRHIICLAAHLYIPIATCSSATVNGGLSETGIAGKIAGK